MAESRSSHLSRRDFLKAITLWVSGLMTALVGIPALGSLLGPALESTQDEGLIDLGLLEDYPVGIPSRFEATRTRVNGWERTAISHGMYVVRIGDGEVRVFSDICTHLGCRVTWKPQITNYVSPCHDGHFDILGNVLSGPPPRPLDEYPARVEAGRLLVSLPAFRRSG